MIDPLGKGRGESTHFSIVGRQIDCIGDKYPDAVKTNVFIPLCLQNSQSVRGGGNGSDTLRRDARRLLGVERSNLSMLLIHISLFSSIKPLTLLGLHFSPKENEASSSCFLLRDNLLIDESSNLLIFYSLALTVVLCHE